MEFSDKWICNSCGDYVANEELKPCINCGELTCPECREYIEEEKLIYCQTCAAHYGYID